MSDNDEFEDWPDTTPVTGSAQTQPREDDEDQLPVATFWLPDPTSRSGWSMRHVWRPAKPDRQRRIGFRR